MLRISKAALVAAVLSLSALPSVGLLPAAAEASGKAAAPLELSIPTIVPVESSMDEAAIRDTLSGGFMQHVNELSTLSAASITIPEIKMTVSVGEGESATTTTTIYHNLVLANVKNGVAETMSIGAVENEGGEGSFSFDEVTTTKFDIGRILSLFSLVDGDTAGGMQPLYTSYTFSGGTFDSDKVSCTIGKITSGQVDARPLKVSIAAMITAAEQLDKAGDANPAPEAFRTVVTFLTDIFQAFRTSPTTMDGLSCDGTDDDDNAISIRLDSLDIGGFQPAVYPAITLNGLKIEREDEGSISLDKAVFKAIDFTQPIAAVEAALDTITPAWFEDNWRQVIPAFGGFSLSGLDVDMPDPESEGARIQASIADFDLSLSDYVNGLPSRLSTRASGVNVPLDAESGDDNVQMLIALGIERINLGYELSAFWDRASQSINIDKVSVHGEDLGGLAVAAVLGHATEDLFASDSDTSLAAGLALTLKSLKVDVTDEGLGDLLTPLLADDSDADPATIRQQLAATVEGAVIQILGSTPEARTLGASISDFIAGKARNVTVNIAAKDPEGIAVPALMQASEDPTKLIGAFDVTGASQ